MHHIAENGLHIVIPNKRITFAGVNEGEALGLDPFVAKKLVDDGHAEYAVRLRVKKTRENLRKGDPAYREGDLIAVTSAQAEALIARGEAEHFDKPVAAPAKK
jgi:hypothetical protein